MAEQTANDSDLFEASDFEEVEEQATEQSDESTVEASDEKSATPENTNDESEAAPEDSPVTGAQAEDPISDFLANKGIKSDDPEALRKVAEMYQNAEKGFYSKSQRAAQLERQLREAQAPVERPTEANATNNVALNEVRRLRTEMTVKEWKAAKNLTPEAEQKMMEWCAQPMTDASGNILRDANGNPFLKGINFANGALSLDDIYRLSGAETIGMDDLKEQMRAEARKEMAARQSAKRPTANSTDSTQFGNPNAKDDFLDGLLS